MGAINSRTGRALKQEVFSVAARVKGPSNYFHRHRRNYLSAVVNGEQKIVRQIDKEIILRLGRLEGSTAQIVFRKKLWERVLLGYLHKGYPLANALLLLSLRVRRASIVNPQVNEYLRYRKPAVLEIEKKISQLEYLSLKLALQNAKRNGLTELATTIEKEVVSKARAVSAYERTLASEHLVQ